jgi:phage terminase small subunit
MARKRKLTPKQKLFCDEYLIDFNATRAYKAAGYSVRSDNVAGVEGHKLLKNPNVVKYLEKRMKERERRTEITQDRVLKELAKIGFADIKDFLSYRTEKTVVDVDMDGTEIIGYKQIVDAKPSDEVDGAVINEISIAKDGTFKFKLQDKMKALEMMGRHLGMWNDKLQLGGDVEIDVHLVDDEDVEG